MLKTKSPDRKKKRVIKKILFVSIFFVIFMIAGVFGIYSLIMIKLHQQDYVSPLATIGFARASQSEDVVERIKKELTKQNIEYISVQKTKDATYIATLKKGGIVTFSSQKDIITQIASLQYILSHLTMEGKLFTRLDLRFEKPVIVLK